MKRIIVVTDSSANIPANLVEQLDIRIVPIVLAVDGQVFKDGVDITATEVYQLLRQTEHLPTTASPSVGDFVEVYNAAAPEASGIVSIHVSPELSTTYTAALDASQLVTDVPIRIVNSHTAAMAAGFVVLEAARAAVAGADLETVVARAEQVASKVNLLATIDTLEYLYRGGRIGGAATLVGTKLHIQPVLSVGNGHVNLFATPRTRSKAIRIILEEMAKRVDDRPVHAAILSADVAEEAEALRRRVAENFHCVELYVTELTPVMGTHTGPGVVGIAFYSD
jgi:DegV family protein with EDD domain